MVERQPYEVLHGLGGGVEVRHYPAHRVVSVDVRAGFEQAGNLGFQPLVGYISGANESGQAIAMTSPVLLEPHDSQGQTVSFVLPQRWWTRDVPAPRQEGVRIAQRDESTMGAIRFRGLWREDRVKENETILRRVLAQHGFEVTGAPLYARYDPPSVPGMMRRNEVLLPVSKP